MQYGTGGVGRLKSKVVNPFRAVVRLFVNVFGITQPSPEAEARAGWVIGAMLTGVLLLVGVMGWVLRTAIFH